MNQFSLDYRYVKAFLITARHLNFSKAAEELGIAQSAVSRQIKLLEDSLKQQLLVRTSKKVTLTKMGEELLLNLNQFENKIKDIFFPDSSKSIHIGILHGFLETWFKDVIVEITKKYQYQLHIEVDSLENLRTKLQDGKYDVIFTSEASKNELVHSTKILEEKMVLISKRNIPLENLYNHPWIVFSNQDHLFQISKKQSDRIITINSITAMIDLVKKGLGIAIVPEHTIGNQENLHIFQMKNITKSNIYLSTLNYKTLPDYIKLITDLVINDTQKK